MARGASQLALVASRQLAQLTMGCARLALALTPLKRVEVGGGADGGPKNGEKDGEKGMKIRPSFFNGYGYGSGKLRKVGALFGVF
jgi:hypothetical protein